MNWPERRLGELIRIRSGGTPNKAEPRYWDGDIPWLSSKDLTSPRIYDAPLRVTEAGVSNGTRLMPENTVMFVVRGMSLASEFRVSITRCPCAFNQDLKAVECGDEITPDFIYYALSAQRQQIKSQAGEASHGTKKLETQTVENIRLNVPDLATQKRVVSIVSPYDDLIENNRRRIALLEEAARLLYREWFVHFRFPGHEHTKFIDGLPEGWQRLKLSDAFDTTSGGTPSRGHPEYFEGDINWVKTQELNELPIFQTDERITEDALQASAAKLFPTDTLLVSIYGGTNIGRTGVLAEPAASNQACVALFPKRRKQDWMYAQQWLQQTRSCIVGIAQGAAQTNISQQTLRGLEMVWPKASLLDDFIEAVQCNYEQIKCLCQQNQKLAQARDLLLPRLMSGELAV